MVVTAALAGAMNERSGGKSVGCIQTCLSVSRTMWGCSGGVLGALLDGRGAGLISMFGYMLFSRRGGWGNFE